MTDLGQTVDPVKLTRAEPDAIQELLVAARKIVRQAQRAAGDQAVRGACNEAADAITKALVVRNGGTGESFACSR